MIPPGQGEQVAGAYNYGFQLAIQKFEVVVLAVFAGLALNQVAQISLSRGWATGEEKHEVLAETVRDAGLHLAFTLSIWLVIVSQIFGKAVRVTAR